MRAGNLIHPGCTRKGKVVRGRLAAIALTRRQRDQERCVSTSDIKSPLAIQFLDTRDA